MLATFDMVGNERDCVLSAAHPTAQIRHHVGTLVLGGTDGLDGHGLLGGLVDEDRIA